MKLARLGVVTLALAASLGCASSTEAPPAAMQEAPALADANPAQLAEEADKKSALVPSPLETQAALAAAGIDTELASLVPASRTFRAEADADRVAVRAGVVLADMLLTAKTSSQEQLLAQLGAIRASMTTLGGGPDIDAVLAQLEDKVKAGAMSRDELVKEFEELASVAIPELEFNGVARIVPLIQAGSWLEGAHLVARAGKEKGDPAAVSPLLKQPAVVSFFAEYAKAQVAGQVPSEVAGALDATLAKLGAIAGKAEPLADVDVAEVVETTGAVLALL